MTACVIQDGEDLHVRKLSVVTVRMGSVLLLMSALVSMAGLQPIVEPLFIKEAA
jgi:hypothetical protein